MIAAPQSVTVVGAGIVGVACALYLQRDGHAVTLVDRDAPGQACSRGNAGIFSTDHVAPLAAPHVLRQVPRMLIDPKGPVCIRWRHLPELLPWLVRFAGAASAARVDASARGLAALLSGALDAYEPLLEQAGAEDLITRGGYLVVYESERAYAAARWERDLQRRHGVGLVELNGNEVRNKVPALSNEICRGVLFPEAAYSVNSLRLLEVMASDFQRRGGRLCRAELEAVEPEQNARVRLRTSAGDIDADSLVLALGAWSGAFANRLGFDVPLEAERGYHVMVAGPGPHLPLPVMSAEYKVVATPMETGLRLAGTAEFAGLNAPPNYTRAQALVHRGKRLLPDLVVDDYSRWMGPRPTLPDSLPVIARSPHHGGVYFAFGHQHLGLTLGAVTGRLVAELVAGRRSEADLAPYRIDRF